MTASQWAMWVCGPIIIILSILASFCRIHAWSHRASDAAAVMVMIGAVLWAVDGHLALSAVWLLFAVFQGITSVLIRKCQRADAEIIALQTEIEAMRHEY